MGGFVFAFANYRKNKEQNKSGVYVVETKDSIAEVENTQNNPEQNPAEEPEEDKNNETNKPSEDPKDNTVHTSNLDKPSGNFVSIHKVSSKTKMESTCITTPGAKCKIVLTKGNVVKQLHEMSTDRNGYTAWIWSPSELGITSGSWNVKAIATLNNQTKEAEDATPLEVTP